MSDRPLRSRKPRSSAPGGHTAGAKPAAPRPAHEGGRMTILYGWHPGRRGPAQRQRARSAASRHGELGPALCARSSASLPIEPEIVRPDEINRLLEPDAVHQGLYLEADPLPSPDLDTLERRARRARARPDHRSAQCRRHRPHGGGFRVEAIVTTARHSPAATGVLAKVGLGRPRARAVPDRPQSRRGADRARASAASSASASIRRARRRSTKSPARRARSSSCSARKARACASARASAATWSAGSTCRARSRASTSRTPPRSRFMRSRRRSGANLASAGPGPTGG